MCLVDPAMTIQAETQTSVECPAPPASGAVERTTIRLLSRVPGLRGLTRSRLAITAMRGSFWTIVGYGASQSFKLISTLVLAHFLIPQAFGAVALVNVFLSGLEMLSDLGIGMDVVQHKSGDDPIFINTAFFIQTIRGVVLCAIAVSLSFPFVRFYRQPEVFWLLNVASLSVLFRGLTSGSMWTMLRHVRMGTYNLVTTGSDFCGLVVSVVWALVSPTAWALVAGKVAATVVLVALSHYVAESQVTTAWEWSAAKDILKFGSGVVLGTATYFLSGEAERLVVGRFVTLAELGCFSLALSISTAASSGLQQIVMRVFFPMISKSVREDRQLALEYYKRTRYALCGVCSVLAAVFVLGSHVIVSHLLSDRYAETAWMLQLLGVRGALELFTLLSVSMLFALGTSSYGAIGNTLKLIFLAGGLSVAFGYFGFYEALWVLAVAPFITYIPFIIGLWRHFRPALRVELGSFAILVLVICGSELLSFAFKRYAIL
jgi:O-antigen/teichoic acid export membrane protein